MTSNYDITKIKKIVTFFGDTV